jgi:hypothetical protein
VKRALLLVALAALLAVAAGCAGDDDSTETDTTTTTEAEASGRVYFLRDERVWPVRREVDDVQKALDFLVAGPTEQEETELEATTAIRVGGIELEVESTEDGVATLSSSGDLTAAALAQIVYTATQFADVESVALDGRSYTRADFEEQTPSVLVESPLAFDIVSSPIVVTGTANTFEATFNYEIVNVNDFVIDGDFVTATSGSGTRGTFELTSEFVLEAAGPGALVVFELSAEDGTRIHEVSTPLVLEG